MKIKSIFLAAVLSIASFSAFAETVNINKADAPALQHYLSGVGEVKSQSIVKYRQEHKRFKKIEEIKNVKGIGDTLFNKIKSSLSLTKGVTSAPARSTKKEMTKKTSSKKKTKATKTKKK